MLDKTLFKDQKEITASIVTYNSADEIDILMTSLQNCSSFNAMTVFVVDNASHDDTVSLIKNKYPWARVIENSKNIGFGRAHNLVIRNVNSKYHIIVNPDILLPAHTIERAVAFMDNNLDVVILTPYVANTDGTQQFLPKRNPSMKYLIGGFLENQFKFAKQLRDEYTMKNEVVREPTDVEFCTGAFMFVRTKALQEVNGFDERYFLHFEDADLTRELKKIGRAVYNPEILVTHKWHRDNKGKSFWVALKSMCLYMRKWSNTSES